MLPRHKSAKVQETPVSSTTQNSEIQEVWNFLRILKNIQLLNHQHWSVMNHFGREEQDLKQLISKNQVLVTF